MEINSNLKNLRLRSDLGARELARQLGTNHQTILHWEKINKVGSTEFVAPIAEALGVTVEEVLGLGRPRNTVTVGGRMGEVFKEVSNLPRRRQEKIVSVVEALLLQNKLELEESNK